MAKTKLIVAFGNALTEVENALKQIKGSIGAFQPVTSQQQAHLLKAFANTEEAAKTVERHLESLDRRMNDPKVTDRIRSLKNIFKDKETLKRSRQSAKQYFRICAASSIS